MVSASKLMPSHLQEQPERKEVRATAAERLCFLLSNTAIVAILKAWTTRSLDCLLLGAASDPRYRN